MKPIIGAPTWLKERMKALRKQKPPTLEQVHTQLKASAKTSAALDLLEAEDPKEFLKKHTQRKWSVNFIKRSSRPWEQAIYNVDARSEEEAIEKGWARLQHEVPKRWRVFRLYACNKV